jgi:hypothetical protein
VTIRYNFSYRVENLPSNDSKPLWREALLVALPERLPLAVAESVMWSELAGENFLTRSGGTGPLVHDHIVPRLAEHTGASLRSSALIAA